jgi:hypothetical protein
VPAETFEIMYAAHTASCTFLLDSEGVCRRIVMAPHVKRKETQTAARCVGAQYVASLDAAAAGCLVEMPRIGTAMLFARVDERGRVSLVRTGPCTAFEQHPAQDHDPFDSVSVKTSAPVMTPRTQPPRTQPSHDHDPGYFDADERTVRIQALRPEDAVRFDGEGEAATAEYQLPQRSSARPASSEVRESSKSNPPRASAPAPRSPDAMPTLRNPRRDGLDDEENPYARAVRGMLPANQQRDSARQRAVEALSAFTRRRR